MRGILKRIADAIVGRANNENSQTVWVSTSAPANVNPIQDNSTHIHIENFIVEGSDLSDPVVIERKNATADIGTASETGSNNFAELRKEAPETHKLIDQYRDLSNDGKTTTAITLLKNILAEYESGPASVLLRAHLNLGLAHNLAGDISSAIKHLSSASRYCKDHPKAKAAHSLSLLLDRQFQAAFEAAQATLDIDPSEDLAAIALCHAASEIEDVDLNASLNIDELESESVWLAYLEFLRRREPENWQQAAERAVAKFPANRDLKAEVALAVLPDTASATDFVLGARSEADREAKIADAAETLKERAYELLKRDPPNPLVVGPFVNNAALALRLAGKQSDSEELIQRAFQLEFEPQPYLIEQRALSLLNLGRQRDALEFLNRYELTPHLSIMRSNILAETGEIDDSRNGLKAALAMDLEASDRTLALCLLFEIEAEAANRDGALEALDLLDEVGISDAQRAILQHRFDHQFQRLSPEGAKTDDRSSAAAKLQSLKGLAEDAERLAFDERLQLARELADAGAPREASDLLHELVSLNRLTPALRVYLDATFQAGLLNRLVETIEALAPDVQGEPYVLRIATAAYFNAGEVSKSNKTARTLYERNPENIGALLQYVQCLFRIDRQRRAYDLVKATDEDRAEGSIAEKRNLAILLMQAGEVSRAQKYAHRLYLQNRDQIDAWQSVMATILPINDISRSTNEAPLDLTRAGFDAAVEIALPDGGERCFIIEEDQELRALQDDALAPDTPLAQALIGLEAGSVFGWPIEEPKGEARVVSVRHKYVATFQSIMERIEERFGRAGGLTTVPVNIEDKENGFENVIRVARERREYIDQRVAAYKDSPMPLSMLAKQINIDPIDVFVSMHRESKQKVLVALGSEDYRNIGLQRIVEFRGKGCLIDPTSAWVAFTLGLEGILKKLFGKIYYTQSTLDLALHRKMEASGSLAQAERSPDSLGGTLGYADGKPQYFEVNIEQIREKARTADNFANWIQEHCSRTSEIVPDELADLANELREIDDGYLVADCVGARERGCLLISEDLKVRHFAESNFGVSGCWMQAVLLYAFDQKIIDARTYTRHVACLADIGEDYITIKSECVVAALEMARASSDDEWIARSILGCLGGTGADVQSHILVANGAIRPIWRSSLPDLVKKQHVSRILRAVTRSRDDAGDLIETFHQAYSRMGPPDLADHVDQWRKGNLFGSSSGQSL